MAKREQLVKEAMEWVGTPFHANQAAKGLGADCVGTVAGIATACGITLSGVKRAYPLQPDGTLKPYMDSHLERVEGNPAAGDVLLMAFDGTEPHHLAMYIGDGKIVHAYVGARRVAMQAYTEHWKNMVVGVYRFPGVE